MLEQMALGKYRLLQSLGQGSNAEVFLAEPIHNPSNPVVVKRIHPHVVEHPKFRQLFEAEVRSMANFSHPYAVRFLEASIDDPIGPSLVMEYVPGITLEALLRRSRILDVERVGRLLGYFGHALDAAHSAGIIHRDLKPANLMVSKVETNAESLKVMDFGFAGFAAKPHIQLAELTGHGPIFAMGTPGYVSPEMIRGDRVDGRSDLYAVGVILYELLTGRLPFDFASQEKVLEAHVRNSPPRFAKVGAKHIPAGIEAVVNLALAKYPNERPQSAQELVHMYGQTLSVNYWEATAPIGWEALPTAVDLTPPARSAPNLPTDPFRITHEFDAFMPERLAAAKLRGFVEDMGGQVLASEPGLIRLRIGVPLGYKETKKGSGLFGWFRNIGKPTVPRGQEPVELELHMEKPNPSQPRLNVLVAFRPLKDYPPPNAHNWRDRCEKLNTMLRQYLGT
jgi:eukaryotic-like serine/threonine-protein kinase